MSDLSEAQVRDFARWLAPDRTDNVQLRTGVVAGFTGHRVDVYLSGASYSVGIDKLSTLDARVGDTVKILKMGPAYLAFAVQWVGLTAMEAFHLVGAAGEPAFSTNWSNYDGGSTWHTAGFAIDPEGWVHLRGLVKHSAGGSGTVIFTMPVGYRPTVTTENPVVVAGAGNPEFGLVQVLTNGDVKFAGTTALGAGSAVGYLSLSTIRFRAGTSVDAVISTPDWAVAEPIETKSANYVGSPFLYFNEREDGLVRCLGGYIPLALARQAHLPEMCSERWTHLFGVYSYPGAGSSLDYGRGDLVGSMRYVDGLDMTASATSNMDWNKCGMWNRKALGGWTNPALQNSWINFGGDHCPARYRKDKYGVVHVNGLIKNGTTTIGTTIFTLPVGYRPLKGLIFQAYSNGVLQRIDVNADGTVKVGGANWSQNSFVTLTDVFFLAEQ